jgi:hypothetical protein
MSKKVVRSVINSTPHVHAYCSSCSWTSGGTGAETQRVRNELYRHLRAGECKQGAIEVGRISHYQCIDQE